jgi:RNA polymerase primary sigma factor
MINSLADAAASGYTPRPESETRRLVCLARQRGRRGRSAMDALLHQNIRLILKVARRYRNLCTPTVTEDDLVQAALIGFLHAVRLFRMNNGNRFSTYVVTCMRRYVTRTIANDAAGLRISVNRQRQRHHIRRAVAELTARSGKDPSPAQIARRTGLSKAQIAAALAVPTVTCSLDDEIDEHDTTLGDLIPAENASTPDGEPLRPELIRYLKSALPPRLFEVVVLHYGLHPDHPEGLTYHAIGRRYHVSRQRVQQLIHIANDLLRQPPHADALRQLLDPSP